jgi:hypothetical protein
LKLRFVAWLVFVSLGQGQNKSPEAPGFWTPGNSNDGVIDQRTAMEEILPGTTLFEINPGLDPDKLGEVFRIRRRLHIVGWLNVAAAEALYHSLNEYREWSSFLTGNGRMYEAPFEVRSKYTDEHEQELVNLANASARQDGFAYTYDASRRVSPQTAARARDPLLLLNFAGFVNSGVFTEFVRRVTGIEEIAYIDVQAMRLRSGHFITFRDTTPFADKERKCSAFFSYNLTPEWKPEWGGLLEFRGQEGHLVEAYIPCFNCLDIFALPQGHWVSVVSPFASGPSYSVSGSIYVR